ncbi:MAG TPA: transposase, partial [Tepidisphaeraceae bacterium]|nr:transposase [Tepidisphaeraceae bacterium]
GGMVSHVLNRAAARHKMFKRDEDYAAFERVMAEALDRTPTRLLGWCLMPNHWHLIVWPREDGELTQFFKWLTLTHAMRWRVAHRSVGYGPLYQGRFKSFPIHGDAEHLQMVLRYVERNARSAELSRRAEDWR